MNHQKQCSKCQNAFRCGSSSEEGRCWCYEYSAIFTPDARLDCLCPACLKKASIERIAQSIQTMTPSELYAKIKELPSTLLMEDIDYYMEEDRYVFTSWYHIKRGYCCGNGCRHCPYK